MSLHVLQPGLASRVVDLGRPTSRSLGVPVGGAADQSALRLGNAILGNEPDAAALEVMLVGPRLAADAEHFGVFWGEGFDFKINRVSHAVNKTFQLRPGDRLDILPTHQSSCGYLCVAGGLEAAHVLGSRSGLVPIAAGNVLPARASRGRVRQALVPPWCQPDMPIRILPGSHAEPQALSMFLAQEYVVLPESNRMGIRLQGGQPLPLALGELPSAPVCPGTIQLPPSGQPIILGRDGQTIGGYPRLAHVIAADLDRMAALRPGCRVRFEVVSLEAASHWSHDRQRWLDLWQSRLRLSAQLMLAALG